MPRMNRPRQSIPNFAALLEAPLIEDARRNLTRFGGFCVERILKHRPLIFRLLSNDLPFRKLKIEKRKPQFSSISLGDFDLSDLKQSLSRIQLPFWVDISSPGHPDKKRLMTVHDFFKYTEKQGELISGMYEG